VIQSSLAFESDRKTGRLPQLALVVHTQSGDVVLARDGVAIADATALYKADGSRLADGTTPAGGTTGEVVYRGALTIGFLHEGDEGVGVVTVLPSRRGEMQIDLDNATGLLSDLLLTVPMVGTDADVVLTFPGLPVTDRLARFRGEIARVVLENERCAVEVRSA
jgi:hypothetical protein